MAASEEGPHPMTTMLEKMARSLFDREAARRGWVGGWEGNSARHGRFRDAARAALQAIREPTLEVIESGMIAGQFTGYADVAFTAMIDAILNEKPEGGA
jgi:hypothetical protein